MLQANLDATCTIKVDDRRSRPIITEKTIRRYSTSLPRAILSIFSCIFAFHFTHPSKYHDPTCVLRTIPTFFLNVNAFYLFLFFSFDPFSFSSLYSSLFFSFPFFLFFSFCFRFSLESRSLDNGFGTVFGRLVRTDAIEGRATPGTFNFTNNYLRLL